MSYINKSTSKYNPQQKKKQNPIQKDHLKTANTSEVQSIQKTLRSSENECQTVPTTCLFLTKKSGHKKCFQLRTPVVISYELGLQHRC